MFDIQELVTYTTDETGFACEWDAEFNPNLANIETLAGTAVVTLGGLNIERVSELDTIASVVEFQQQADDFLFVFTSHIVCLQEELHLHWKTLHDAYIKWSPYNAAERQFSTVMLRQGNMMGISNSRTWWLDEWAISAPVTFGN